MLQNLIGILANPITIFVIFALIGGLGRFASWVKDQRARRDALAARRAAHAEALRTGRAGTQTSEAGGSTPQGEPATARSAAAERQARLRQMQEKRAAQLRELQQKRLAELRARRAAQQSGSPGAAPTAPPPRAASAEPAPPRRRERTAAKPATAPSRPAAPAASRPAPKAVAPTDEQAAYERKRDRRLVPDAFAIDRKDLSEERAAAAVQRARATATAFDRPTVGVAARTPGAALFASRDDLRRGILAAEILGPSVALREST